MKDNCEAFLVALGGGFASGKLCSKRKNHRGHHTFDSDILCSERGCLRKARVFDLVEKTGRWLCLEHRKDGST